MTPILRTPTTTTQQVEEDAKRCSPSSTKNSITDALLNVAIGIAITNEHRFSHTMNSRRSRSSASYNPIYYFRTATHHVAECKVDDDEAHCAC